MESYLELLERTGSNRENRFWDDSWTMVYNQGMEVTFREQKIYLYFNYTPVENGTLSDCTSTLVGWYRDHRDDSYTCARARRETGGGSRRLAKSRVPFQGDWWGDRLFKGHQQIVDQLNRMHLTWQAGLAHGWEQITAGEMQEKLGSDSA